MSIFEIGMLVCFGISWPINLVKAWRSRTAAGQSLWFLLVINIGYISGIIHKILYNPDLVMALYIINFLMVTASICMWFRNKKIDRERASLAAETEN